jgi:O-antigen ligase
MQNHNLELGFLPGFMSYQFGHVVVEFRRTLVGFIFAALICSSMAITVSRIKLTYRLLAAVCLGVNALLLLITGSIGSSLACLCGLGAIFYAQSRVVNIMRGLISITVICSLLFLVWTISPVTVKDYVQGQFQNRIRIGTDQDRFTLWARAISYLSKNPEGVGWTNVVGDRIKTNTHNDYLVFAVSYGFAGGIAYAYIIVRLLVYFLKRRKKIMEDSHAAAIHLAGLGVIVVVAINSISDHMTGVLWYFNVVWSIIWYCYFCSRGDTQTIRYEMNITPATKQINYTA